MIPDAVTDFFGALGNPGTWARGGVIVGGALLIILGFIALVTGSESGRRAIGGAASVATTVATKGAIK